MLKYTFSGHETFHCKSFWLKKGYDYITQGHSFVDENAVIELGVGKNMVASIRFWMKSFGLLNNENELTHFAHHIFDENEGLDKYLEDRTTLWLLHYMLAATNYASIYSLVFGEYHRSRNEFDMQALEGFLKRKCFEEDFPFNSNTIQKDIRTLIRNYVQPVTSGSIDELYSTLLLDLGLILHFKNSESEKDTYSFNLRNTNLPPYQLIVFILLSSFKDNTIDFRDLMYGKNPIGLILCLTENVMDRLLREADENFNWLVYKEDAGNKQVQIKERPNDNWSILELYYQTVQAKNNEI
ncbi:hypothetical protein M2132_002189 [Dysgonomonas sp. PH5-45]|uniref:DUF4007 family protein n=1 Tax=unclassified Dysgonomonas TaxID=2630389 RepID=UPI002474E2CC|nr:MULTISPECIES: DUF4007 family protein [unclassified Dysgonomonas]MDH6355839.1 hypothetical protein [Dysgonomonas sp. PH5-45]MDH6388733.1 hypothetical protein [Dysgonomonas sp. PH5-37]